MGLFSRKKTKLIELMHGMTDIHCHLLPGIDDGSKDVDQSLSMIYLYRELGFIGAIATPHILKGAYPNTPESISNSYSLLKAKEGEFEDFKLSYAAEHMIDEDFEQMVENKTVLPLVGTKVLVEMSYRLKPHGLKETLFKLGMAGFQPILAHPERYVFLNTEKEFSDLFKICEFQLNALSLSNHYGPEVQKKAFRLLLNNQYNYIGTDAHHERHLEKLALIEIPKKYLKAVSDIIESTKSLVLDN